MTLDLMNILTTLTVTKRKMIYQIPSYKEFGSLIIKNLIKMFIFKINNLLFVRLKIKCSY
jgi:hypothetical protein